MQLLWVIMTFSGITSVHHYRDEIWLIHVWWLSSKWPSWCLIDWYMQTLRRFIGVVGEACQDLWSNDTFNSISRSFFCWCRSWGRAKVLLQNILLLERLLLQYRVWFTYFFHLRRERCNLCFVELEKVKNKLPFLTRYWAILILYFREFVLMTCNSHVTKIAVSCIYFFGSSESKCTIVSSSPNMTIHTKIGKKLRCYI